MGRSCKCKDCGKTLNTDNAYKNEYLTDDLAIKREYYCDEKCFKSHEDKKEAKEFCKNKFDEILKFKTNGYFFFKAMLKDIVECYGWIELRKFLELRGERIKHKLDDIDFKSNDAKIKYFFAIVQNWIGHSDVVVKEKIDIPTPAYDDSYDYMPVRKRKQKTKKRSLDDLF